MPIDISRQKLVDAVVDNVTTVRNASNNRISIPRYIRSSGTVTVGAGATFTDISDQDADDNYTVLVEVSWGTTVFITSKTASGFRINFGTAVPSGGRTIRWVKVRSL